MNFILQVILKLVFEFKAVFNMSRHISGFSENEFQPTYFVQYIDLKKPKSKNLIRKEENFINIEILIQFLNSYRKSLANTNKNCRQSQIKAEIEKICNSGFGKN
jgi:hypothetical protein